MKVGDLVKFPCNNGEPMGIVVQVGKSPHRRSASHHTRAKVYWVQDAEMSWEPKKWLEVVSESL